MFSQYGELRSANDWDQFGSLEHPSKCQRVSPLGFVSAPTSLNGGKPNLHDVWPFTGMVHFRGLLPLWHFTRCKIYFAPKSCVLLYWQRYCTTLEKWASAKRSVVEQRVPPIFGRRPSRWASANILVCAKKPLNPNQPITYRLECSI